MKDRAPREKASERNMGLGWATWFFFVWSAMLHFWALIFGLWFTCVFVHACQSFRLVCVGACWLALLFRKLRLMAEVPSVEVLSMKPKEGGGGEGGVGWGVSWAIHTRTHGSSPWWERVEEEA